MREWLCCPLCRAGVRVGVMPADEDGDGELVCEGGHRWPIVAGVPDMRVSADPYIGLEKDREKARMLARALVGRSFGEVLTYYYEHTDVVPAQHAEKYKRSVLGALGRSKSTLELWREMLGLGGGGAGGEWLSGSRLLDVGCGTGPLLIAAGSAGGWCVGVDIALRWLVVGRKRLAESGGGEQRVATVCGCAEALPFRDGLFTHVTMDSTIEHLRDQRAGLGEARRVSGEGVELLVVTPNKLFPGPDPHMGTLMTSWRRGESLARVARRLGAITPVRSMLSERGLRGLLGGAGFEVRGVTVPGVSEVQRAGFGGVGRAAIGVYSAARGVGLGRAALRLVGPVLVASARAGRR